MRSGCAKGGLTFSYYHLERDEDYSPLEGSELEARRAIHEDRETKRKDGTGTYGD